MFSKTPVVYAVGTDYQILFYVKKAAYAFVEIGDAVFEDCAAGNLRSAPGMRRITVPQAALDAAGGYTLCLERIRKRKCYRTKTLGVTKQAYPFYPVLESGTVRAYMLGDSHGDSARTLAAAKQFGKFDFLIVNGDCGESVNRRSFNLAHNLAAQLTGGSRPVVYARGNHENRGAAAELLPNYVPVRNGLTYYSFRLGSVWGLVLDSGEDKADSHPEYGGSVRFHDFRLAQTAYLQSLIAQAKTEFDAPGVLHRIAVVHTDFPRKQEPEFDIERELFQSWCDLLGEMRVEAILAAHLHQFRFLRPGDEDLRMKIPCPLAVGTANTKAYIGGTGIEFSQTAIKLQFVTSDKKVLRQETIGSDHETV